MILINNDTSGFGLLIVAIKLWLITIVKVNDGIRRRAVGAKQLRVAANVQGIGYLLLPDLYWPRLYKFRARLLLRCFHVFVLSQPLHHCKHECTILKDDCCTLQQPHLTMSPDMLCLCFLVSSFENSDLLGSLDLEHGERH